MQHRTFSYYGAKLLLTRAGANSYAMPIDLNCGIHHPIVVDTI